MTTVDTAISLYEYNRKINAVLSDTRLQRCWVTAETVDVSLKNGHCYFELVQKNPETNKIEAKIRAIIWAGVFAKLSRLFLEATGQKFDNGLKVMVEVSPNFHEQYGLSLVVSNINPTYTLGDLARIRKEILDRLRKENIIDLNKQLPWCEVPQRIAVISADTAAGYGDFINQLHNNPYGLAYYTALFPAYMQGVYTVPTVLAALQKIAANKDKFDCVVVIRGGGATTDLNVFDNYDLAAAIATFPLPVIVGIGHDRDYTVLDDVASVRVKTPTAAAEFLVDRGQYALAKLQELTDKVVNLVNQMIKESHKEVEYYANSIPLVASNIIVRQKSLLNNYLNAIPLYASGRIKSAAKDVDTVAKQIKMSAINILEREKSRLDALSKQSDLLSPRQVMKRGYAIVRTGGKYITNANQLKPGEKIFVHLAKGKIVTTVNKIEE